MDTGIGILDTELPYLFAKFSRGKDISRLNTGGTGAACNIITFIILLWNQGWSDGDYAFSSLKAVVKSIFWTIYIFLYLKNSRRAQATFVEA